jgi:hypothetical protein
MTTRTNLKGFSVLMLFDPALGTNGLEAILNSKLSVGMLGAST